MEIVDFYYNSSDGKSKIHGRKWIPKDKKIYNIIQIAHGMVENLTYHELFANYFVEHNFLVVGNDLIGHGLTMKSEDELGMISDSKDLIEDMHKLREIIQQEYPNIPYFLIGFSFGSFLVRKYINIYSDKNLNGAIIYGTNSHKPSRLYFSLKLISLMALFYGWNHRSFYLLRKQFSSPHYKKFDLRTGDPKKSWLTRNEKYAIRKYKRLPFPLCGYYVVVETAYYISLDSGVTNIRKDLPIYLISGGDDPGSFFGTGTIKVFQLFKKNGLTNVSMRIFGLDRHSLMEEYDRINVYDDLIRWMNENGKK